MYTKIGKQRLMQYEFVTEEIQSIQQCNTLSRFSWKPEAHKPHPYCSDEAAIENALKSLDERHQENIQIHEDNKPKIEINKSIRQAIEDLMTAVKMPKAYWVENPKSRSWPKKKMKVDAGWVVDVRRIKINDEFDNACSSYEQIKKNLKDLLEKTRRAAEQAAQCREAEQKRQAKEREELMELAEIILRYGLDRQSSWQDVYHALRGSNPRLNLAMAMLETREDWSDGADKVSCALYQSDEFPDKQILENVSQYVWDWDGDGRVFRDCEWNYDRILDTIDKQLVQDCLKAKDYEVY